MAVTLDTMISVLQRAIDIREKHKVPYSSPKIKDLDLEGVDEHDCFDHAVREKHINTKQDDCFGIAPTIKDELYRLLEKQEAKHREEMFLRYAKTQSDNSTRSYNSASRMFFASVIYFAVTALAIWCPRAVNVNCPSNLNAPKTVTVASPCEVEKSHNNAPTRNCSEKRQNCVIDLIEE